MSLCRKCEPGLSDSPIYSERGDLMAAKPLGYWPNVFVLYAVLRPFVNDLSKNASLFPII